MLGKMVSTPLTDSRSLANPEETVFFALRTPTGDGHLYIDNLYARGVRVFVIDATRPLPDYPDACFLAVENVPEALSASAAYMRRQLDGPVIAITGSRGKTIVKEMLYGALLPLVRAVRSPRSYNSAIGVPLSLWEIEPESRVGIFEAGISERGEMEPIANLLSPTIGIFTALTDEHGRGFASMQEKCREKALLFATCHTVIFSDTNPIIDDTLRALYPDKELIGCHTYIDMCIAAAKVLGFNIDATAVPAPVQSRIDITDTPDSATLAYDYFTCDASAVSTALDVVRRRTPSMRPVCVVAGDLLCNPAEEEECYRRFARALHDYGVTSLIAAGETISRYAAIFPETVNVRTYPDGPRQVMEQLRPDSFFNTTVYINGSDKDAFHRLYTWLNSRRNITRLEINLDSLAHNFRHYRSILPPQTGIVAMIKACAYGCGDIEVARTLQTLGADMVAVAVVDEGVALRRAGVTMPILVLDPWCENMRAIFAHNLQPTITDGSERILSQLEFNADAEGVDRIDVHLKLDTGMHRVGLSEEELPRFLEMLARHPRIRIVSAFSHLATADCLDLEDYTTAQLETFRRMTTLISSTLPYPVKRHILNTAGMTRYGREHVYELARLGIGLYGITPLDAADAAHLRPVARLVTSIIAVNSYPAGTKVGYGCRGVLTRPSTIATIPVGYADGIDRHLGEGHASFLVNGTLCPTVGRICMDLCMIDITDCPDIGNGEVEIFGPEAPIERLSDALDTIPYEVLASVSPRVKRVYYRE